jgi:hypothetical protein
LYVAIWVLDVIPWNLCLGPRSQHRTETDLLGSISYLEELQFLPPKIMSTIWRLILGGLCNTSHCICVILYGLCLEGRLNEKRRIVAEFLIRPRWLQRVWRDYAAAVQAHIES